MRFTIALLAAAVLLIAAGCPGNDPAPQYLDGQVQRFDQGVKWDKSIGPRPDGQGPLPDKGTTNPCEQFDKSGQSCAGGQACPPGLQPANIGSDPCKCYVPCDPDKQSFCHPIECDRVCVQLVDSNQQPLPGAGACVADPGAGEGEPCTPVCKQGLFCVAASAEAAFCRKSCTDAKDCLGFKIVCVPLQDPKVNVCIPGGSTTGPKEGEQCGGPNIFCQQDLICDPATKLCVLACDPNKSTCTSGTCTKLEDTQAKVVVGYGCK